MMREIGSEFWHGCTPLGGDGVAAYLPQGFDVRPVLSGRTALELAIRDVLCNKPAAKAYLPAYCCHTMIEPFLKNGLQVLFYDVVYNGNGLELCFCEDHGCDIVLLMDYFGYTSAQTAHLMKTQAEQGKPVIYDATHSFFCEGMDYRFCDYVIASLRKWLPVNAGFCAKNVPFSDFPALQRQEAYEQMREQSFAEKADYMKTGCGDKTAFLQRFAAAEELLETAYSGYTADRRSLDVLQNVDVHALRDARRQNAKHLIDGISALNVSWLRAIPQTVAETDCPLFVPLWVSPEKRAALRSHLIENDIYLPAHWPLSPQHPTEAPEIYRAELSCVCDQRYTESDMDRILDAMRRFASI